MANHKTGAQRRNDKMDKIFEAAYERAARDAGWSPTGPHGKWVCAGDPTFAKGSYMPTPRACRYICEDHDLLGLRSSPPKTEARCAWFALCENDAVATKPHPILGEVPICQRCADKMARIESQCHRPEV